MGTFEPKAIDDSAWDGILLGDVKAGFPSPAEEVREEFDLKGMLVRHPASTFYFKVDGFSMVDAGMEDGDIIIVDKSLHPYDGCKAICYIDGEFTVKHVEICNEEIRLVPMNRSNPRYKTIVVSPEDEFAIWGIVTYVIKKM
ncbi:MAG: translesion error-prone DNA polymerase V autoproteolytic subunit [Bacteroidales bacterium]|nr:translesion error-prone DNA polymerase V autoproteolytic subunit [Bacteroidales bacterium]